MWETVVMGKVIKTVLCLGGIPHSDVIIKLLELWLLPLVLSLITSDVFDLIKTADFRCYNTAKETYRDIFQ